MQDAVAQDDRIDDRMHHPVPEAKAGDCVQVLEKSARQKDKSSSHHIRPAKPNLLVVHDHNVEKTHLVSTIPVWKAPIIRSPQSTTYRIQVMSNSINWAPNTMYPPTFCPNTSWAISL